MTKHFTFACFHFMSSGVGFAGLVFDRNACTLHASYLMRIDGLRLRNCDSNP